MYGPEIHLRWSLALLSDGLDSHSWPDYENKGVGFGICKTLNPIFLN